MDTEHGGAATGGEQTYVAQHYAPRAQDYVTSLVHSTGEDLDQLEAWLRRHRPARLVDLGCGGGHVSYRAAPHVGRVTACDVTPAMLDAVARTAAERGLGTIDTVEAAAERLPFEAGRFEAVACRFSAHHWGDLEGGLREARRVLTPGGRGLFIDSVAPGRPALDSHLQTVELLRDPSHGRNYTVAEWVAGFQRAGFALEGVTPRRLRMDYPVWIARTRAPDVMAAAIRALQRGASPAVREHFAIGEDGGFDLDVVTFEVVAA